jgi:thiamine-phosphate pyrophosphorylase
MVPTDAPLLGRLMLVTDRHRTRRRDLVEIVARAAEGGVGLVQVRERDLTEDQLRDLVTRIGAAVPVTTEVLVNTSLPVARSTGAGLHLPARAASAGPARAVLPRYGRSVHDEDELRAAVADGATYVVVGPVFATRGKLRPAGPALIERACRLVVPLPVFAIGGMTVTRVPGMVHSGAHGVAVSSAILEADDPARVAQAFCLALEVARRARSAVQA